MKLRNKQTGEIGYFCFANWNDPVLIIMDKNGVQLAKYNSLAELERNWEDYDETKELYWCIGDNGVLISSYHYEKLHPTLDKYRKELGNYFKTKKDAEKAVEKLKAWKRLKDKGFRLDATVGDTLFCLDIFMRDDAYEPLKDDLKIVFGGEE